MLLAGLLVARMNPYSLGLAACILEQKNGREEFLKELLKNIRLTGYVQKGNALSSLAYIIRYRQRPQLSIKNCLFIFMNIGFEV